MAGVTVLRIAARDALLSSGGRGFVRFVAQGDALLVTDALRRAEDAQEKAALIDAIKGAGFSCFEEDGLLYMTPGDALLFEVCNAQPEGICVDWAHPLCEAMAFAARLAGEAPLPLDEGGRRLIIETIRLLWQPEEKVLAGLSSLRAMAAVRLREGKRGGLNEAGRLLCGWLAENAE